MNKLGGLFSAAVASAIKAESDYADAVATVGVEMAESCKAWAQTTIVPNGEAFGICWRAGGPGNAERDPGYRDALITNVRRMHRPYY